MGRIGGGGLDSLFAPINDPRAKERIRYPLSSLFFGALLMYLCGLGARRSIKSSLNIPLVVAKMEMLGAPGMPHGDSINDLFKIVAVDEVQQVITHCADRLQRSRFFDRYRLLGTDYLLAFDGTWTLKFKEPHADNCLTQTHNEKTTYYYMVLEAKLVTSNGLAISLMSEFVENVEPNASKQDCETKAFLRLVDRIKQRFPRLPFTLLLDGLFTCGPVFDVCHRYGWHYFATLKDKDLPSVHEEMRSLAPMQADNYATRDLADTGVIINQDVSWVTDIAYVDSVNRKHNVSVITCKETKTTTQVRPRRNKGVYTTNGTLVPRPPSAAITTFSWITNHTVNTANIWALMPAARRRWKIEEGFNEQKNHGDLNLKHAYTYDANAVKVFYLVLQLAHLFLQLMYKSTLLRGTSAENAASLREVTKNMREAWRNVWHLEKLFEPPGRFQIRLPLPPDTS